MKDIDEAIQHCDIDKKLTNRQAIGVLDGLWSNPLFGEAHRQAFEIGIKAIKALEQEQCEDAISRQAAIEAFQMFREYESNRSNKGWVNRIETVLNQLPPVTPQQKWIPVSERLPEDRQSVLVWCPQYKNIYCAYLEKEQWWIFGAFVQIVPNEVVAWMPLPTPYEPQERNGEE